MKSWLFAITVLVLLCTCIESLKTKHGESKIKHSRGKNETSEKESTRVETNRKSKGPPIGLFALKFPKKPKHTNRKGASKQSKKNSSDKVSRLLRELRKCMSINARNVTCKKSKLKNAKKAMIWPNKMLPSLEKILINKINGAGNPAGDNNGDNGYENYSPTDNSFGNSFSPTLSSTGKNDYSDNWDSVNVQHHHRSKFHGMDVVPLLKMLKEKVGDSSSYDPNAFTGMPSNEGGNKYLTKMLLNQALGKPDRGAVMKDMMQEFFLANRNERSGEEAREAFNELLGHDNLIGVNSQMEAENSAVNVAPTQGLSGLSGAMGRQSMPERIQRFGSQSGVLQAQELPNGQIAPINEPAMGQRMMANRPGMQEMVPQVDNRPGMQEMMPQVANNPIGTRMLNNENFPGNMPPVVNNVIQNQLAANIAAVRNAQSRSIPFAKSNNLIFEEEGESAARGIRPPPFAAAPSSYEAERMMKLGPNYQSSAIPGSQRPVVSRVPQRDEMAMRDGEEGQGNVVGVQGERYDDEVAAFIPRYPTFNKQMNIIEHMN